MLLSLAFAQEKVTKEKSARLAPVRRTEKDRALAVNRAQWFDFFCEAHLCPRPPAGVAISAAKMKMTAEPSAVLSCCVVGIRRPIAGGL